MHCISQLMSLTLVLSNTVAEHYFAMAKPDARLSLEIYKRFARQTEQAVKYLARARQLENALMITVPNIRHVQYNKLLVYFSGSSDCEKFTRLHCPWQQLWKNIWTMQLINQGSSNSLSKAPMQLLQLPIQLQYQLLRRIRLVSFQRLILRLCQLFLTYSFQDCSRLYPQLKPRRKRNHRSWSTSFPVWKANKQLLFSRHRSHRRQQCPFKRRGKHSITHSEQRY